MFANLNFIPHIEEYVIVKKINKGCSGDEKYQLEKEGRFYLLRVGDSSNAAIKYKEFQHLRLYVDTDVNTHRPVDFGVIGNRFYSIVTWVDGTTIMEVVKRDVTKDYYDLGKKAGAELRKLHQYSYMENKVDWYLIIKQRAEHIIKVCRSRNIELVNGYATEYLFNNLELVKGRQNVLLHGDFHWINCVVSDEGRFGIIDFAGDTEGDPWYEFGAMLWILEWSESFANGQIDGYFDDVPLRFWEVFKLYTVLYAYEHLNFDNGQSLESRIKNSTRMLEIFGDDYKEDIPLFRKNSKLKVL